jgi:hypothetical protein
MTGSLIAACAMNFEVIGVSHADVGPSCLNCNTRLHGKFCHTCGQKAASASVKCTTSCTGDARVSASRREDPEHAEAAGGQTRAATVEFLEGRRARFISPLRVYLTFSLIFFTLAAVLPRSLEGAVKIKGGTGLKGDTDIEQRLASGMRKASNDAELIQHEVLKQLPKVMFVLMPVFALLIWPFYRKQQRFYIPHLYYSVHFHAFAFLVMSVYVVVNRIGVPRQLAALLILTVIPCHFLALRRVYGGSIGITFAKGFAVGFLYWLIAILSVLALTFAILINL